MANWTPKLNNQSFVESELSKAFKMWSDYSRLEFVQSDDYYGSDIVIAFGRYSHGDSYPFDGPGHNEAKAFIKSYLDLQIQKTFQGCLIYRGSSLSTIFGILKKSYYVKFVLVGTT